MKAKIKFISKIESKKWLQISNLFAKSMVSPTEALRQFNSLDATARNSIKRAFVLFDDVRRKKIPKGEADIVWEISVMVDAHIVATEFDIDPLIVIMCINPPCKLNERVYIK